MTTSPPIHNWTGQTGRMTIASRWSARGTTGRRQPWAVMTSGIALNATTLIHVISCSGSLHRNSSTGWASHPILILWIGPDHNVRRDQAFAWPEKHLGVIIVLTLDAARDEKSARCWPLWLIVISSRRMLKGFAELHPSPSTSSLRRRERLTSFMREQWSITHPSI